MTWRPTTEKPTTTEPLSALIAARDIDGEFFLVGIYIWKNGAWVDEDVHRPLREQAPCWWVDERELLKELEVRALQ